MAKVILITGASTGIGAETARLLASGNEILIHYNASGKAAGEVAREVEARSGKAHLLPADLCTEEGCERLVQEVGRRVDHLDVLVNNAGGLVRRQSVRELSWDLMTEVFALNVFSLMKVTALCVPLLEKGKDPCIVNLSSVAARHGASSATIYGAAKGAVDTLTRGMAKELAPKIRVNAVAPGVIDTPFHQKVSTPQMLQAWKESCPLKKNGQPIHIALAIRFCIENDFMTGETIDVNGGSNMR